MTAAYDYSPSDDCPYYEFVECHPNTGRGKRTCLSKDPTVGRFTEGIKEKLCDHYEYLGPGSDRICKILKYPDHQGVLED